ncbi:hypothetical protein BN439_0619 [Erwinia amylovora Ea644]|nr:hypothetical protein [Erwinia amylovora]CCP01708.1 hypothetical protein BN439_0619 [Erwinia amylovora Ea644]CCP05707.1 hypothetical protein BN440_0656 [Erwinia amylovora MR1]
MVRRLTGAIPGLRAAKPSIVPSLVSIGCAGVKAMLRASVGLLTGRVKVALSLKSGANRINVPDISAGEKMIKKCEIVHRNKASAAMLIILNLRPTFNENTQVLTVCLC